MGNRFIDNNDGTVTDTTTGLMWQQDSASNSMTFKKSLVYCEGLNLGGYTDWRLPTIQELLIIVDFTRYKPAINTTYFPKTHSSFYWSSTTFASYTGSAWGVNFSYGNGYGNKGSSFYVRAVRGEQSGSSVEG